MKRLFILLTTFLFPLIAFGLNGHLFTWEIPTQRENGDALPVSDIQGYKIFCGTTAGGPYNIVNFPVTGGNKNSFDTGNVLPDGEYFCKAITIDTDGRESRFSNESNFTVGRCQTTDCRPFPPVLTVTP